MIYAHSIASLPCAICPLKYARDFVVIWYQFVMDSCESVYSYSSVSSNWHWIDLNAHQRLLLSILHQCISDLTHWGRDKMAAISQTDTFKRIVLKENFRVSIKISLRFVPKSPIDNIPALFQIMAWCRSGDKPLSEAMKVSLLTHICVARPQWVNKQHGCIFTFS